MNMHLARSVETSTELREIAAVAKQMISPRLSKPLISIVQDTLVGVNRLTRPSEFFTRREFMNLLIHSKHWDGIVPPPAKTDPFPRWSGQQIVSCLLPAIHISMGNKMWGKADATGKKNMDTVGNDQYVIIKNGLIVQGILDGDVFDNALINILYNDFSADMTVDFIDGLQAVVAAYLQNAGFSVGLSDLIADEATMTKIANASDEQKKQLESFQLQVHMGLFENSTGRSNQEEFEGRVFTILNKMTEKAGVIGLTSLTDNNRMVNMIKCGSKGSNTNIAQMISLLGQQAIDGRRIGYGFQDRTLPHFKRYDDGAAARGYIENSFVKGLTPHEFFFHAMTGREGLIDTAVKTADSGYLQRQLVKAMEDLIAHYDGSIRDSGGLIVQFAYGDDASSSTKIENQSIGLAKMSDDDIRTQFSQTDVPPERSQAYVESVLSDRNLLIRNVWNRKTDNKSVRSAVHLERLISTAVVQHELKKNAEPAATLVSAAHVLDTMDTILVRTNPANRLWAALLRFHLNPTSIRAKGFTRGAFDWLAEQIMVKHLKSWVTPGEMSGILAAQSIGEPSTQMSASKDSIVVLRKISTTLNSDSESMTNTDMFMGPVGEFADALMARNKSAVWATPHGPDSQVLDLAQDEQWAILGVSNDEKASWRPISQVSRHPANGGLVKVSTQSGRTTTATLTHSFLRRTANGIAEVKGADLRVGQRIPVAMRQPESPNALSVYRNIRMDYDFGWMVGMYLAGGSCKGTTVSMCAIAPIVEERIRAFAATHAWPVTLDANTLRIESKHLADVLGDLCCVDVADKKCLLAPIAHAKERFIAGFLSGVFDGDGSVNASRLCVSSRSQTLLRDMARLLPVCGIFGTLCEEQQTEQQPSALYTLTLLRKHAKRFEAEVGLHVPEKAAALRSFVESNEMDLSDDLDRIPELGHVLAATGCFATGDSIGRRALEAFLATTTDTTDNLAILRSAAESDVMWDEITALEILADPHERVYDFTVPGNDSFMVDDSIFVHNTLNTFHLSGVAGKSGMTRGVPRLKELFKVTQNPKATGLTVFMRPDIRNSKEDARRLTQSLEFTLLRDVVTTCRIYYDPRDADTLIAEDQEWLSFFAEFEKDQMVDADADAETETVTSPWLLRLELDREKMFNKNITMEEIHAVIRKTNESDVPVSYTDHNASSMVLRIRMPPQGSNSTQDVLDDLSHIKLLQTKLLTQTLIRGLPGLRSVSFRKLSKETEDEVYELDTDSGTYKAVDQFVLETYGTNFIDTAIHPDVDGLRLSSNHVHDIYDNLGIEATCLMLYREIMTLFEQASAHVNSRHVSLLCDTMCNRGRLMPVDRYGVNKKKTGPLAKASFEQTEVLMLNAAMFGELDPVTGVSANIMTGQPIRGGTAFAQILLDETMLANLLETAPAARRTIERAPTFSQGDISQMLNRAEEPGCRTVDLQAMLPAPFLEPNGPLDTVTELPELEINMVNDSSNMYDQEA